MNMTPKGLARVIASMTYGDLKSVATDFAAMCEEMEPRGTPKTAEDFAELLNDWAEAQIEDEPEQEAA